MFKQLICLLVGDTPDILTTYIKKSVKKNRLQYYQVIATGHELEWSAYFTLSS